MTTQVPNLLPEVGSKLKNGSILLASRDIGRDFHVVLACHAGAGAADPFCVWKVEATTGNAFWGDYHDNLPDAYGAFFARV